MLDIPPEHPDVLSETGKAVSRTAEVFPRNANAGAMAGRGSAQARAESSRHGRRLPVAIGLVTGAMIGFDPVALKKEFNITERYLPVMLIAVGYATPGNPLRKSRLTVDEAMSFDFGRIY